MAGDGCGLLVDDALCTTFVERIFQFGRIQPVWTGSANVDEFYGFRIVLFLL